ncbi:MAG: cytochrome ubiquinol oxidase subunit I [Paracoccus sp. (in: a-proteobacteria)]|uniref:cytochrome ubiquinol oxidase subunit I n=1 Tax=unclassified Paracoccus (in: a-proteobacteria) TaxID=2688777 RepID=UPI000C4DA5BF|nr:MULTISPECIES: cytochrome ubiquinol oxidase subunit I [unclassified Paracoccus (in: a-proteobacteria)]MAN56457.1 cytochrome d terminal oxidase subunit 1 [Paracoccus sp. (in: a-proteobacteria)]MBA50311.1 cytochrome d terminal oxidase subunit 1 [Paracoccus sp. (in: a-proteobacteria)]MCS5601986.1 cytochrome ubiquinol oxidase subunit I [Paracoccus sp. (in: a-proteobacteria)]|tara:strand:- start:589 stop:2169 length:1581 start_codon:yes stop_codon:yes gene_type:complete
MDIGVVELSRLQFAMTALYHFLFVPLTLGLSILVAIMETVYVMTNRPIWRQMTKFWGLLFGINFAMGVATGVVMEFQFGMNWSYYSQYVGDVFGAPLAIEGLMAFFMEATFVGLWFFGWDRLSKVGHLVVGWLVAIGSNFSALWILIANGWMQNPVGAEFNPITMRMELTSFFEVMFNSVAQAKFVHTVSAGYVTAAIFVLGVSSWYMLRGRHLALARRSIAVAASFGLASALSVVVLGDESGYDAGLNQKMKLAAIEAMWETDPAPAPFTLLGIPDQQARETKWAVRIPYVMGLIGTRSLTREIPGIEELVQEAEQRVRSGLIAYDALMTIQQDRENTDPGVNAVFQRHSDDLGYALLLRRYLDDPRQATEAQIAQAAADTVPRVWPIFWSFRIMVGLGLLFIAATGYFFIISSFRRGRYPKWALRGAVMMIPLPWVAAELGWIVAEYGRQPWTVDGILPTALSVSALSATEVLLTIAGFAAFYTLLFVIEVRLLLKYIRLGPQEDVQITDDWRASHRARLKPAE